MAKQVAVQESKTTALVADVPPNEAWGSEGFDTQDILISKLLLQQSLSKYVVDGTAKPGDMVDSVSGEVLGGKKEPVEIIPINMFKTITIEEFRNGKFEYIRQEPVKEFPTQMEYEQDGKKFRVNKALNFYVLHAAKAKDADTFPMVLSFRRTSFMAGKSLATHFAKAAIGKYPPASKVFTLGSEQVKNDKGTFHIFSGIKVARDSSSEELGNAYNWFKTLKSAAVKIDDSDEKEEVVHTTSTSDVTEF